MAPKADISLGILENMEIQELLSFRLRMLKFGRLKERKDLQVVNQLNVEYINGNHQNRENKNLKRIMQPKLPFKPPSQPPKIPILKGFTLEH